MGTLETLRKKASRSGTGDKTGLYECRNCGENLETDGLDCPTCGSHEIAYYDL